MSDKELHEREPEQTGTALEHIPWPEVWLSESWDLRIKVTDFPNILWQVQCHEEAEAVISTCLLCISRQKITQQYSQQVSTALQQWETEAQRSEEQEEKFNVGSAAIAEF